MEPPGIGRKCGGDNRVARMSVPNVLATRYASAQMREIWAPEAKVVAERRLWLAVLRAQRDLGVDFGGADPDEVISAYKVVVNKVDLDRRAHV